MSIYGSINVPTWLAVLFATLFGIEVLLQLVRLALRFVSMRQAAARDRAVRDMAARYAKQRPRPEEYR